MSILATLIMCLAILAVVFILDYRRRH